jgi:hypothetical protein
MTTYRHSQDMPEISGFGGDYEKCCQDMLEAGVKWLHDNPQPSLEAHSFEGVYGVMVPDSDDAKRLESAVLEAAGGDATGAMHHAVMSRLFWISKNGWDAYCKELCDRPND